MWKKVAKAMAVTLVWGCFALAMDKPDHLSDAKKKFPHSLIGDDFGILDAEDLAIPTCHVLPEPYSDTPGKNVNAFAYWKCFPTSNIKVDCSGGGYDQDEHSVLTVMGIVIKNEQETHEYITRRAIPLKGCKNWQQDWKRLSKNQSHVCFSGSSMSKETEMQDGKPIQKYYWIFESYKTHLGCSSYFEGGGCSLPYQMKHGCKVTEAKVDR